MKRPGLLAFVLACLAICRHAQAQVTTGTILGTVTDQSGGCWRARQSRRPTSTRVSRAAHGRTDRGPICWPTCRSVRMRFGRRRDRSRHKKSGHRCWSSISVCASTSSSSSAPWPRPSRSGAARPCCRPINRTSTRSSRSARSRALPLNGRDFFSLLLLSNGVQDTSKDQAGATTNVTFSVNGMRPESNSVTLDGVQMSSVRESDVDLRPNVDAISEFKVLTSLLLRRIRSHRRRRHLHSE